MSVSAKILSFDEAPEVCRRLRAEGKKLVQCHGTFDLIHPGHIVHFEEARALGDVLVVTVTAEAFVNKGPGRPYFNDALRLKSLAALEPVDYVVLVPYPAAVEAIECVRPDVYCKGKEYEDPGSDVTGNIRDDVATVERLGGRVAYVGSVVFSSTRLLNRHFDALSAEVKTFCRSVAEECPPARLREHVDSFEDLRVLIVGDIIFDRYTTVGVQGLTSKNRILSGRFLGDDMQAGGALAVFRHVREFTPQVKLVSLVGTESWVNETLGLYVPQECDEILRVPGFTTIVKQRFVEPVSEGTELSKLFAVNFIDGAHPGQDVQEQVCDRIAGQIADYDVVMVADFGHGLLEKPVRELVQEKSPFMSLNCQTNSNNHGFNIINRQYRRTDCFSLDQRELKLACGLRYVDFVAELGALQKTLGARCGWLTRGAVETIGVNERGESCSCPPFEMSAVDTVGAGDAFWAVSSLAAVKELPLAVATFAGQLAGAQAVRIVGNTEPIRKARFLKGLSGMLTF